LNQSNEGSKKHRLPRIRAQRGAGKEARALRLNLYGGEAYAREADPGGPSVHLKSFEAAADQVLDG
jgi:hypothetical protein